MHNQSPADFPALSFSIDELATTLFADWLNLVSQQAPHRLERTKTSSHYPADDVRQAFLSG